MENMSYTVFASFYTELLSAGFWALNSDDTQELYDMLTDGLAIRFADKGKSKYGN